MSNPETPDPQLLAYVQAAAAMLRLPLDAQRAQSVAQHLVRTAAMAQLLESAPLEAHDEPVALFCPAPFPAEDAP